MERRTEQSLRAEETERTLREDRSVVGLWARLQIEQEKTNRIIVTERDNGEIQQTTIRPDGSVTKKAGTIRVRRIDRGNPIRQITFIPDDGSEEIILSQKEF